ncbi:hypothetical protein BDW22DRAFT_342670 [Trametopsis cervina]|nr:hypothetical protein BDW22DRAFT_342670 [Trametopsis cervina]
MPKISDPQVNLKYALPPYIQSLQAGWLAVLPSAAAVGGLLAATETSFLVFFKTPPQNPGDDFAATKASHNAILILTYIALLFSISATFSSLVLADEFAGLPDHAARSDVPTEGNLITRDHWHALVTYGLRPAVGWLVMHWMASLIIAILAVFAQVVVFAFNAEPIVVRQVVLIAAIFALVPVLAFVMTHTMDTRRKGGYRPVAITEQS